VSFVTDKEIVVLPSVDNQQLKVRTIMSFCGKSLTIEPSMFKRFLYVHVLNLSRSNMKTIPKSIGSLIHLRLFDIQSTSITCLPLTVIKKSSGIELAALWRFAQPSINSHSIM
jgi:hypothetical protein